MEYAVLKSSILGHLVTILSVNISHRFNCFNRSLFGGEKKVPNR